MIQRIQTLWLLLASACSAATLFFPFYTGNKDNNLFIEINAQSHFLSLFLTVAVILESILAIFFYKNRKKQMIIVAVSLIAQILNIVFFLYQTKPFLQGAISFTALFTFIIPVFLVLALLGIRKDEKLVQSMDRLR
jgi:heme/copper-type cytochrome/quinol oxidase subunit 4